MGTKKSLTDDITYKVTCTTEPFSADSAGLLLMPGHHGLDDTEGLDDFVLFIFASWTVDSGKKLFALVVAEVQNNGSSNERKKRVLL